jgi:beta-lactamase class A
MSIETISSSILDALATPSLIIESLDDDRRIEINAEADIYPASMIKLPLAYATAVALANGSIDESPIVVEERWMTNNDAPSPFVTGYSADVWELVDAMISFSDNVATNVLIDRVGRGRATTICQTAGLSKTAIRRFVSGSLPRIADPDACGENAHPTRDAAILLRMIAHDEVPCAERIRDAMNKQHWNDKLSAGLKIGDTFAHKTGDTSEVSHDGGILTTAEGKHYVVVLYTTSPSNKETDSLFASAMQNLRAYL